MDRQLFEHLPRPKMEPLARISHTFSSRSGGRAGVSALCATRDPQAGAPGPRKRTVWYVEEADGGGPPALRVTQSGRIIAPMQ